MEHSFIVAAPRVPTPPPYNNPTVFPWMFSETDARAVAYWFSRRDPARAYGVITIDADTVDWLPRDSTPGGTPTPAL